MAWLGRRYPVPIVRPLWPFFAAGATVFFGIWKLQNAMMDSDEFKNDPRHPKNRAGGH